MTCNQVKCLPVFSRVRVLNEDFKKFWRRSTFNVISDHTHTRGLCGLSKKRAATAFSCWQGSGTSRRSPTLVDSGTRRAGVQRLPGR